MPTYGYLCIKFFEGWKMLLKFPRKTVVHRVFELRRAPVNCNNLYEIIIFYDIYAHLCTFNA